MKCNCIQTALALLITWVLWEEVHIDMLEGKPVQWTALQSAETLQQCQGDLETALQKGLTGMTHYENKSGGIVEIFRAQNAIVSTERGESGTKSLGRVAYHCYPDHMDPRK